MNKIRVSVQVHGIVQGVGFRPFIHKQITDHSLNGWIRNTSAGAEIDIEGTPERVDLFVQELWTKSPKLALIEGVETQQKELMNYTDFKIIESKASGEKTALISPDVCTCPDCLKELFESTDHRYRYPFINCTNCGPRFTIIKDVPYDRAQTTMAPFIMCPDCEREYKTITDRRYHAQPDCCPTCGPELYYTDQDGRRLTGDPIRLAQEALKNGKIIAVKGLGGFHLACRCDDQQLAETLRKRKHRDEKPFAIMCETAADAETYCVIRDGERAMLEDIHRPIVLIRKKDPKAYSYISENHRIGIMLPYTPVHYLLLHDELKALIMTSANVSDQPIIYKNEEALEKLHGIADGFLLNNREIHVRCDDSVMWVDGTVPYFARRSRGYVPFPVSVFSLQHKILACGAEQKATFALTKGSYLFPSQHIGDLKNLETYDNYEQQIGHFERLFDIRPEMIVCDLHPDYMSSVYAHERAEAEGLPLFEVQHHHAHMASCMADNRLDEPVIGILFDGTGLGTDGTIWGAEFFTGDYESFERRGSILPVKLPGGDRAAKQIWRTGCSLAIQAGCTLEDEPHMKLVEQLLEMGINTPAVTSMGRLFDGAAALMGIRETVSYEGQGAILLEAAAEECDEHYSYEILQDGKYVFDYRPMIRQIVQDRKEHRPIGIRAAMFMNTIADMSTQIVKRIAADTKLSKVVMSGGTFQNMYLLNKLTKLLEAEGFEVYHHNRVSCNDEGISLGQSMIGERLLNKEMEK